MKAAFFTKYGSPDVVSIKEVEKPIPNDNEILVKVYATTVNSGDARLRRADPFIVRLFFGLFKPSTNILGVDVAGVVEEIGKDVTLYKVGDQINGSTYGNGFGAHAEYICLKEDGVLAQKPENLSFDESVSIFFGGHTALHFLRKANIKRGQKVLIYGASGSVGTYGVQLAKYFGAEVTGVCSGANVELVKSLGADKVIDYTTTNFTKNEEIYDIIFDTVGKSPFLGSIHSLSKKGIFLRAVHMSIVPIIQGIWFGLTTNKKIIAGVASENKEDLIFLNELANIGKLIPVIDRIYPLKKISEAHEFVDKGHKKGNVVIKLQK
jgi:NADPH:quinone reductase-like Zn-dependent oxidoreductase